MGGYLLVNKSITKNCICKFTFWQIRHCHFSPFRILNWQFCWLGIFNVHWVHSTLDVLWCSARCPHHLHLLLVYQTVLFYSTIPYLYHQPLHYLVTVATGSTRWTKPELTSYNFRKWLKLIALLGVVLINSPIRKIDFKIYVRDNNECRPTRRSWTCLAGYATTGCEIRLSFIQTTVIWWLSDDMENMEPCGYCLEKMIFHCYMSVTDCSMSS